MQMTDSCVFLEEYLWHFKKTLGIEKARYNMKSSQQMTTLQQNVVTFSESSFLRTISPLCTSTELLGLLKSSPSRIQQDYFYMCKSKRFSEIELLGQKLHYPTTSKTKKHLHSPLTQIASHCANEQTHLFCFDIHSSSDIYLQLQKEKNISKSLVVQDYKLILSTLRQ